MPQELAPLLMILGLALAVLPFARRDSNLFRTIATLICAALVLRYLGWRLFQTLPPLTLTPESLWAWTFMAFELFAGLSGLTVLFFLSRTHDRGAEADANADWPRIHRPRVALLLPTYNEDREILERSIQGAQAQDYDNYAVYVLDDGRRDWLRDLCVERGVGYLRRSDNAHAKAGNMNAGLARIEAAGDRPEILAILDADFVAMPGFISRSLALMHDPAVGVVQTPQHFFNDDPFQHAFRAGATLPDEQRFFFDTILPAKDAWGTAFSCGTSSLVRRAALEAVGGFPTESVTEDMLLSLKLQAKGWKTVYLNERLSQGLAPEGMGEYISQRARWCLGLMQILRTAWGPFGKSGLRAVDRLSEVDSALYWIATFPFRIMCFVVPIAFWFTGVSVLKADLPELVAHLGPAVSCQAILLAWLSRGRILPLMTDANQILVAPEAIRAAVTGLVRPKGHKFVVTAKGGDRSRVVVQWRVMARMGAVIALTLAGVVYGQINPFMPYAGHEAAWVAMFWSYYNILVLLIACTACIELPRHREERFRTDERVMIDLPAGAMQFRLQDLSVDGARVEGRGPLPLGAQVVLHLDNAPPIPARVSATGWQGWALDFDQPEALRAMMVGRLFSGAYRPAHREIRFRQVLGAMLRRMAA